MGSMLSLLVHGLKRTAQVHSGRGRITSASITKAGCPYSLNVCFGHNVQ